MTATEVVVDGATSKVGAPLLQPKARTRIDLTRLREQIAAAVQHAQATDPVYSRRKDPLRERSLVLLHGH